MLAPSRTLTAALAALALTTTALADDVTIDVTLIQQDANLYHLGGQSAFIQTRTGSITLGNTLDGISSPGSGVFFTEIFPPPNLSDYKKFGYFGTVQLRTIDDVVQYTSLVVGFLPGHGEGLRIEEIFNDPNITNLGPVVNALTTQFDSAEFNALFNQVLNGSNTLADISIPDLAIPGETLNLVAFDGGPNLDTGRVIGTVTMTVNSSPIPEPASLSLLALGTAALLRRRR